MVATHRGANWLTLAVHSRRIEPTYGARFCVMTNMRSRILTEAPAAESFVRLRTVRGVTTTRPQPGREIEPLDIPGYARLLKRPASP